MIGDILTWPCSGPQGRFHSERFASLANPVVLTVRLAPSDTSSNCLELGFRLWCIDQINPVSRARQWPLAKPTAIVCRSIDPTPETRPSPLFRALDQIGPQGVLLNVTHDSTQRLRPSAAAASFPHHGSTRGIPSLPEHIKLYEACQQLTPAHPTCQYWTGPV